MMGPLIHHAGWRWAFLVWHHPAAAGLHGHRRHRLGEGEDAALRQQERVPDHPQHARGQRRWSTPPPWPARWPPSIRDGTGGDRLPGLCRRRLALQLQRPGAPLLHAPRGQRRRHPGQPRVQTRAQGPEPRHRQTHPAARRRHRRALPGARRRSPKCRPARRCCRPSSRKSTARTRSRACSSPTKVKSIFKQHPRRGGCRLVSSRRINRRTASSSTRKRPRCTASAPPPFHRRSRSPWMAKRSICCTSPRRRRTSTSASNCRAPAKTTPEELLALRVRSGDANALPEPGSAAAPLVPLRELVTVEHGTVDKSLYHKNLMPVTYVIGDVAGVVESPVYAILKMNEALRKLDTREFGGSGAALKIHNAAHAVHRCRTRHEMGWRVAHHHRGLPRSRRGLRRRV